MSASSKLSNNKLTFTATDASSGDLEFGTSGFSFNKSIAFSGGITSNSVTIENGSIEVANQSDLKMSGSTSGTITIQPAAVTTDHTLTLPSNSGDGKLYNDSNGSLSWRGISYCRLSRNSQSSGHSANDYLTWTTTDINSGLTINSSQTVTLVSGRVYEVICGLRLGSAASAGGNWTITDGTTVYGKLRLQSENVGTNYGSLSTVATIIAPNSNINIGIRFVDGSNSTVDVDSYLCIKTID